MNISPTLFISAPRLFVDRFIDMGSSFNRWMGGGRNHISTKMKVIAERIIANKGFWHSEFWSDSVGR